MAFEGIHYQYLGITDSTNLALWRRLKNKPIPEEGTVIHAGFQTDGRGQQGAAWHSEVGENLLFSILLKPVFLPPARQFSLNKTIALAIHDALKTICPEKEFLIKWPNDIIAEGRKLVGTLIENRIMGKRLEATVAGIGLNINQQEFPSDIPHATSLSLLSGKQHDINHCLRIIAEKLQSHYAILSRGEHSAIDEAYLRQLYGLHQKQKYLLDGRKTEAILRGVDEYGKLLLEVDGLQHAYGMKEIAFCL